MRNCDRITQRSVINDMAYDKNTYNNAYKKDKFDFVGVYFPKGYKDKMKTYAESQGISVAELVKTSVYDKLGNPDG